MRDPTPGGFSAADFALLAAIGGDDPPPDAAVDELWARARRLGERLGAEVFGDGRFHADLWPDDPSEPRTPFLWARIKRADATEYATHLGLFLSPGAGNLCLDLEKDRLDDGTAAERLPQVLGYYRSVPDELSSVAHPEAEVWTDSRNRVTVQAFAQIEFDAFMAANRDRDHPWPRVGYRFDPAFIASFGNDWVAHMGRRATPLIPVYEAMLTAYGG